MWRPVTSEKRAVSESQHLLQGTKATNQVTIARKTTLNCFWYQGRQDERNER